MAEGDEGSPRLLAAQMGSAAVTGGFEGPREVLEFVGLPESVAEETVEFQRAFVVGHRFLGTAQMLLRPADGPQDVGLALDVADPDVQAQGTQREVEAPVGPVEALVLLRQVGQGVRAGEAVAEGDGQTVGRFGVPQGRGVVARRFMGADQ